MIEPTIAAVRVHVQEISKVAFLSTSRFVEPDTQSISLKRLYLASIDRLQR
jgi:hypothetical protein